MSEIEKILRDPSAVFADPCEILCQVRFSRDEKIRILQQWRYDLVQLQVATGESLSGDANHNPAIEKINECLRQLHLEPQLVGQE